MFPGERKTAVAAVVEIQVREGSEPVAPGAALAGDLRGELLSVWIAMARLAPGGIRARVEQREAEELPALLALEVHPHRLGNATREGWLRRMAGDASDRLMRALEGIGGLLMVRQFESRRQKTIGGVTGFAGRARAPVGFRELPQMGVGVAVGAALEFQTFELGALSWKGAVAADAGNAAMQALQRESGLVVKIRLLDGGIFDVLPSSRAVAACTSRSEFPLVRIAVAVLTGLVRKLLEAQEALR